MRRRLLRHQGRNGNGLVDPEDIIVRYSDGVDQDHNGYTDDISGWDFYNDQNDPATVDSKYDHANGQQRQAAAQTNNGIGEAGVCPGCMVMPIKAGAEALDRTDDLAQAWLYAADMHVDVLVSVTADLGYSDVHAPGGELLLAPRRRDGPGVERLRLDRPPGRDVLAARAAGQRHRLQRAGLSIVPNRRRGQNGDTTTYRARSGLHLVGHAQHVHGRRRTAGRRRSRRPPSAASMALVLADGQAGGQAGQDRAPADERRGHPGRARDCVRRRTIPIRRNVARRSPGSTSSTATGGPNVDKAMRAISKGEIPPEAWIDSPRLVLALRPDEDAAGWRCAGTSPRRVQRATAGSSQFAPGAEPAERDFIDRRLGHGKQPFEGRLGSIDLSKVPRVLLERAPSSSRTTKTLETNEQYTVTHPRCRSRDAAGPGRRGPAVDRGAPRPDAAQGLPEAHRAGRRERSRRSPTFGARGHLDDRSSATPTGRARARARTGTSCAASRCTRADQGDAGAPRRRPGPRAHRRQRRRGRPRHNGRQWIVVDDSTTGRTYVWSRTRQAAAAGWPKTLDTGVRKPTIPRPDEPFTRRRDHGRGRRRPSSSTSTATASSRSSSRPGTGASTPGTRAAAARGLAGARDAVRPAQRRRAARSRSTTRSSTCRPAVADLDGDGSPSSSSARQYSVRDRAPASRCRPAASRTWSPTTPTAAACPGFLIEAHGARLLLRLGAGVHHRGRQQPRRPPTSTATAGRDRQRGRHLLADHALRPRRPQDTVYGPLPGATLSLLLGESDRDALDVLDGNLPDDAAGELHDLRARSAASGRRSALAYVEPGSGGASVAGVAAARGQRPPDQQLHARLRRRDRRDRCRASPRGAGSRLPRRARRSPTSTATARPEVIEGGDSSALHAFTSAGAQAGGFPKFTTGWEVFGPAVGDLDGDGHRRRGRRHPRGLPDGLEHAREVVGER